MHIPPLSLGELCIRSLKNQSIYLKLEWMKLVTDSRTALQLMGMSLHWMYGFSMIRQPHKTKIQHKLHSSTITIVWATGGK